MIDTLAALEARIASCSRFSICNGAAGGGLQLSAIPAGDPSRGSRNPRILVVTDSPDEKSAGHRGVAARSFAGPTGRRMIELFTHRRWGLMIAPQPEPHAVADFLSSHGIYRTSAVKCIARASTKHPAEVIRNCRDEFLDRQIALFPSLKVILPMGSIAAASVLRMPVSRLFRVVGSPQGMLERDKRYGKAVVVLPHPSGLNVRYAPPDIALLARKEQAVFGETRFSAEEASEIERSERIHRALVFLRAELARAGYSINVDGSGV